MSRDRAEGNIRFYIVMILFGGCCVIMLGVLTASDASVARPFVEGDVPTGAESDGAVSQEEGYVRRRLKPHSSRSAYQPKLPCSDPSRSRTLLEKAFDEGNTWFTELSSFGNCSLFVPHFCFLF